MNTIEPAALNSSGEPMLCRTTLPCDNDEFMKAEVVLTEADIAQEFAEAIEARDLPEKFFYWFPRSAAEWVALAGDPELYGGLAETWKEIASHASALAKHYGPRV